MGIINQKSQDQIDLEQNRLEDIKQAIKHYSSGRIEQLAKFHNQIKTLKQERLDTANWNEKNKLTEKIRDKEAYNPQKYLPEFTQTNAPYFASFTIKDDDVKIGRQCYLLGKQNLFKNNKVVIVDWRQAALSTLFYEYEPGEDYEEEINGKERSGLIENKLRYTIKQSELNRIETGDGCLEKHQGTWIEIGTGQSTSKIKEESGDHHLVDIVSLISPDQFRMITKEYHGCLRLQGSAGAGKTTIALHRLSFLQFNYPQQFRPERCLVIMFNRALRNYVTSTAREMLSPKTAVETFHSWAALCLRSLGLKKITFSSSLPSRFDTIKKASSMAGLIKEYAQTAADAVAISHLIQMYSSRDLVEKYLAAEIDRPSLNRFINHYQQLLQTETLPNEIGFADAGILIRLLQVRLATKTETASCVAFKYFDHMVIDEAQDFSQTELECLYHATTEQRSLTICADPNQQILNFIDSSGLKNFHLQLQKNGINAEQLEISYRSTSEIMEVANAVLGKDSSKGSRHGEPVFFNRYPSKDEAITALHHILIHEQDKSPNGLIAVICKQKSDVANLYEKLQGLQGVRKDPQKFQPGILIINCHQVKGLEFTSVIVWNVSAKSFRPDNTNDRNLLYVSLSRACDRLAVLCHEPPTPSLKHFFTSAPTRH